MTTIKSINKSIAPYGCELVKGKGYFFFDILPSYPDNHPVPDSVYVNALNQLSKDQWLEHVHDFYRLPRHPKKPADQWRKIETAERTKRAILVYDPALGGGDDSIVMMRNFDPSKPHDFTHWMPIKPPGEQSDP